MKAVHAGLMVFMALYIVYMTIQYQVLAPKFYKQLFCISMILTVIWITIPIMYLGFKFTWDSKNILHAFTKLFSWMYHEFTYTDNGIYGFYFSMFISI